MLKKIFIQNYALIDQLEVEFSDKLTIITGETGAGKSILLGAVSLIAGQRSDVSVLQDKSKKCIVEAHFILKDDRLKDFFAINEIDFEKTTIVRREVSVEGRSRAFVNDTPVTLSVLKQLADQLIDIHSQHENLEINSERFQLSVVDSYAGNESILKEYSILYREFKRVSEELEKLRTNEDNSRKDIDYWEFQINELKEAGVKDVDQEKMESELEILNNTEKIKSKVHSVLQAIGGADDGGVMVMIQTAKNLLQSVVKYDDRINVLHNRINSCLIEIKDIEDELESLGDDIFYDPNKAELISNKLDTIYRLQQKHQVKTVRELIEIQLDFEKKIESISFANENIIKMERHKEKIMMDLKGFAEKLSVSRKKSIPHINECIKNMLTSLAMPNALFEISIAEKNIGDKGKDSITFLFSANKGSLLQPIDKVASGGELSRLMLSIKSLMSGAQSLPAIIFDEIDTGVSGAVADKVGGIMSQMAKSMQVITITHLPQIACKGDTHLCVYKEEHKGTTFTRVKKLSKDERVVEIAKMLSSGDPTGIALKNAKELLRSE